MNQQGIHIKKRILRQNVCKAGQQQSLQQFLKNMTNSLIVKQRATIYIHNRQQYGDLTRQISEHTELLMQIQIWKAYNINNQRNYGKSHLIQNFYNDLIPSPFYYDPRFYYGFPGAFCEAIIGQTYTKNSQTENDDCLPMDSVKVQEINFPYPLLHQQVHEDGHVKLQETIMKIQTEKNFLIQSQQQQQEFNFPIQSLKNENRNLIPNTLNKIFAYLRSASKSEKKTKRFLQVNKQINQCHAQKYYGYQKWMKSSMDKFLILQSLEKLFIVLDPEQKFFTLPEQEAFIKINAFLIMDYLRNPFALLTIINSQKVRQKNVKGYLIIIRLIQEKVTKIMAAKKNLQ